MDLKRRSNDLNPWPASLWFSKLKPAFSRIVSLLLSPSCTNATMLQLGSFLNLSAILLSPSDSIIFEAPWKLSTRLPPALVTTSYPIVLPVSQSTAEIVLFFPFRAESQHPSVDAIVSFLANDSSRANSTVLLATSITAGITSFCARK